MSVFQTNWRPLTQRSLCWQCSGDDIMPTSPTWSFSHNARVSRFSSARGHHTEFLYDDNAGNWVGNIIYWNTIEREFTQLRCYLYYIAIYILMRAIMRNNELMRSSCILVIAIWCLSFYISDVFFFCCHKLSDGGSRREGAEGGSLGGGWGVTWSGVDPLTESCL